MENSNTPDVGINDIDISTATEKTAENLYNLMMQLASHIKKIEAENLELRERLANATK